MLHEFLDGNTLNTSSAFQKDLEALLEYVPFGILILDQSFHVQQINQAALELLGIQAPVTQILGISLYEIVNEKLLPRMDFFTGIKGRRIALGKGGNRLSVTVRQSGSLNFLVFLEPAADLPLKSRTPAAGSVAHFHFEDIIGQSDALLRAIEMAKIAAQNNCNVLLTGESGTGKELFAQSIHNQSACCKGPFVPINCGALPRGLIESELFGYDSGSFTGARREGREGKFEQADGGTLFLDEIGELPLDVQSTLLRAIQSREIFRIGGKKGIKVNVRIISATNTPLSGLVQQNRFRGDLFYRLNIFCIGIPALRERAGDLPILTDYFLRNYASQRSDLAIRGFSRDAEQRMAAYPWPGNIRELQNVIERAVYIARSEYIEAEALPAAILQSQTPYAAGREENDTPAPALSENLSFSRMEKQQIEKALAACNGSVAKAADALGINRRTLYRRLEKYCIHPKNFQK